jgi:hypothetical protein
MLNEAGLWKKDLIRPHVWQVEDNVIDNSRKKYYAVDITTDKNDDLPIIGNLLGHVRLITGSPSFDGTPGRAFYEGGAANDNKWYEGILLDDKVGVSSTEIDVTSMGGVGSLSGFSFSIKNCNKQWEYIDNNDIYFLGRRITHYVVLDNIFYPIWSGIVEETSFDDTSVVFSCTSAFNAVHKDMPPQSAVIESFENVDASAEGKSIPVLLGDVYNANILLTNRGIEYIDITGIVDAPYEAGFDVVNTLLFTETTYDLITWDKSFFEDELNDKYLMLVSGGGSIQKNKLIRIIKNYATTYRELYAPLSISKNITRIKIVETFDICADTIANFSTKYRFALGIAVPFTWSVFADIWLAKIVDVDMVYSISNEAILSVNGKTMAYNQQSKKYVDISSIVKSVDTSMGTISLNANILDGNNISVNSYFTPEISYLRPGYFEPTTGVFTSHNFPPYYYTGSMANLTDKNRATGYTIGSLTPPETPYTDKFLCGVSLDIPVTQELVNFVLNSSNFSLCADVSFPEYPHTVPEYTALITGWDAYGQIVGYPIRYAINLDKQIKLQIGITTSPRTFNSIDNEYYNGNTNGEICNKNCKYVFNAVQTYLNEALPLDSAFVELILSGCIKNIKLSLQILDTNSGTPYPMELTVKEIAFQKTESVNVSGDNLVVSASGEKYLTYDTNNVYRAIQHIIYDYDKIAVIDTDMGNLPSTRNNWHTGRQLTEKKSSLDYIKELCEQSMVGYWQDRNGKLSFSSWLDNLSPTGFHNNTTILRNTIKGIQKSIVSGMFNEFSIKYDYDSIADKYNCEFSISHVDESTFPLISDPLWKTYAGGFDDTLYSQASALWYTCRAAYLKNKTIHKLKLECPWFVDCSKLTGAAALFIGTESSAYKLLHTLVSWATVQKNIIKYEVSLDEESVTLDMLDYISFMDSQLTDGAIGGWIINLSNNPTKNIREITIIQNPE